MSFVTKSATLQGSFQLAAGVETAFPLFSPIGEERWAPGWKVEILYPHGAEWEESLVFRTTANPEVIWFVGALDRSQHRVRYHRVEPEMAVTVAVSCTSLGPNSTAVFVEYTYVGRSESGNAQVEELSRSDFGARMKDWQRMVGAAVAA